jgi:hypothetical protein
MSTTSLLWSSPLRAFIELEIVSELVPEMRVSCPGIGLLNELSLKDESPSISLTMGLLVAY